MIGVSEEAKRLREIAEAGPIGKRHSSFKLYELLAECMRLAMRCSRDPAERADLWALFQDQQKNGNRRYVERGSDEYLLVCRYVFAEGRGGAERSNASRYAICLREAAKCQIGPHRLVQYLKTQGGLDSLFQRRPNARRSLTTKALRLREAIEVPKDTEFTITLKRMADNTYAVIRRDHSPT